MKEHWKNISGYEGLYKVSDLGRIKSVSRIVTFIQNNAKKSKYIKGRIRKLGNASQKGHKGLFLFKNNIGECRLVHRLVLEAFVGPCPPEQECRHFPDRDPTNNKLKNLHWGTRSENNLDKRIHGTNGAKPLVVVVCENCGVSTKIENWRSKTKRFCSQKCYHAYPRSDSHKANISSGIRHAHMIRKK